MTDKRSYEERSGDFQISFVSEPVVDFEVEPEVVRPKLRLVVNNERPKGEEPEPK
jgi:hypothetical protein